MATVALVHRFVIQQSVGIDVFVVHRLRLHWLRCDTFALSIGLSIESRCHAAEHGVELTGSGYSNQLVAIFRIMSKVTTATADKTVMICMYMNILSRDEIAGFDPE